MTLSTLRELNAFLWKEKTWWLSPMVGVMLTFAATIALGNATPAGVFIYSVF